ncbi:hypothetical protein AAVH_37778, partial [Aphelenchoides avenae]
MGLAYLQEMGWTYDDTDIPFPSLTSGMSLGIHHAFYVVSCVCGYSLIVYSEVKIMRHLKSSGTATRDTTKRMHAEVNRALIAM